jgi:hypothetical protein
LFNRQTTRNRNIVTVYTCSAVSFGLALSLCLSSFQKEMRGKPFSFYEHVKHWQERARREERKDVGRE